MGATAALLILVAATATPAVALQCPAIAGQTLVYIDIFDGPPENLADLAPDEQQTKAGVGSNTWRLETGRDGVFVKCGYGTWLEGPYTRAETIRLPDTVKTCRADYKTDRQGNYVTLLRFSCR